MADVIARAKSASHDLKAGLALDVVAAVCIASDDPRLAK
jgi:hypothetical protein